MQSIFLHGHIDTNTAQYKKKMSIHQNKIHSNKGMRIFEIQSNRQSTAKKIKMSKCIKLINSITETAIKYLIRCIAFFAKSSIVSFVLVATLSQIIPPMFEPLGQSWYYRFL